MRVTRRRRSWAIVSTAVLVPVAALVAFYLVFFTHDAPERLRLSDRAGSALPGDQLIGRWSVAKGSIAGYRVREKLARLPARRDAVGRTSAVTGGLLLSRDHDRLVVRDARFTVDVQRLESDESRRDRRLRTMGLQTGRFPTARFASSFDIRLPARAATGAAVSVLARGELTIHGVTRTLAVPVDARLRGTTIELAGSLSFLMGDFSIKPPDIAGFVTVDPCATLEFRLLLQRASRSVAAQPIAVTRPVTTTAAARCPTSADVQ